MADDQLEEEVKYIRGTLINYLLKLHVTILKIVFYIDYEDSKNDIGKKQTSSSSRKRIFG